MSDHKIKDNEVAVAAETQEGRQVAAVSAAVVGPDGLSHGFGGELFHLREVFKQQFGEPLEGDGMRLVRDPMQPVAEGQERMKW